MMMRARKTNDLRETPQYDQIYNVTRYDDYRSPRARRLARERKTRHRHNIRRNVIFMAVAIIAIISLAATTMQWHHDAVAKQQAAQATIKRQKPTTDLAKNLPAEIATLGKQLGLPNKTALDNNLKPAGAQISVTVLDLSNQNRGEVHYNDTTQWTSASTYKLFVALEENQRVENGTLSWSSSLNDETLSNCLRQMILVSDNNCPEAWLSTYSSFSKLTATATAIGTSQTAFSVNNMRTSGADLADYFNN